MKTEYIVEYRREWYDDEEERWIPETPVLFDTVWEEEGDAIGASAALMDKLAEELGENLIERDRYNITFKEDEEVYNYSSFRACERW